MDEGDGQWRRDSRPYAERWWQADDPAAAGGDVGEAEFDRSRVGQVEAGCGLRPRDLDLSERAIFLVSYEEGYVWGAS